MSIAKGSRSSVGLYSSTILAVNSGVGLLAPITSESMGETTGILQSEELRPNRTNSTLRGGNISCAGNLGTELPAGVADTLAVIYPGIQSKWPLHELFCGLFGASSLTVFDADDIKISGSSDFSVMGGCNLYRGNLLHYNDLDSSHAAQLVVVTEGTSDDTGWQFFVSGVVSNSYSLGDEVNLDSTHPDTGAIGRVIAIAGKSMVQTYTGHTELPISALSLVKQVIGASSDKRVLFEGIVPISLAITIPQEGLIKLDWSLAATQASVVVSGYDDSIGTSLGVRLAGLDATVSLFSAIFPFLI